MPLKTDPNQGAINPKAIHSRPNSVPSPQSGFGPTFIETLRGAGFALEETHQYAAGQTIFKQGDACHGVMFVLDGTIAIHRAMTASASSLLSLREPGQALGYEGVLAPAHNMTSAIALSDCRICHIETGRFSELLDTHPALNRSLIGHLGLELNAANEARVHTVHLQVLPRLAHLLLGLRDRHGTVDTAGNIVITIPMSRRDMASAIGTRPESLSRAIRELKENGTAQFSGKRVVIADLDDLLDASENQKTTDEAPE
jgi:CRP/FNR family transcriptional regulator